MKHSADSCLQLLDVEIDEQADMAARELEVREYLRPMNRSQRIHTLDLNNHQTLYEKVEPIRTIQLDLSIHDGKRFLTLYFEAHVAKLKVQTCFVRRLQQSWTEMAMDTHGRTDDLSAKLLVRLG